MELIILPHVYCVHAPFTKGRNLVTDVVISVAQSVVYCRGKKG
jgi:hypothetical protein